MSVTLESYIFENARTTENNNDRRKELENWLKHKKYDDYVDTLNKMLEDPKAKTLLQDGFGGSLGNTKFVFSEKKIRAAALRSTQSNIDLEKSLKWALQDPSNINEMFKKEVALMGRPIITFRDNYVIDGHHRWAAIAMVNPDTKIVCFNYDADISFIEMLKAVQGSIASVIADDNGNDGKDGKLPSSKVTNTPNIFSDYWDEKKIKKYINDNISDDAVNKYNNGFKASYTKDEIIDKLTENILSFINNNYPEDNAPERSIMPQTDRGGKNYNDKNSSLPNKEGSALNKMAKKKFDKGAVK